MKTTFKKSLNFMKQVSSHIFFWLEHGISSCRYPSSTGTDNRSNNRMHWNLHIAMYSTFLSCLIALLWFQLNYWNCEFLQYILWLFWLWWWTKAVCFRHKTKAGHETNINRNRGFFHSSNTLQLNSYWGNRVRRGSGRVGSGCVGSRFL